MEKETLVSIVIPTYNRSRILGQAIESVIAQTYGNTEIIVVDDGSTDNTSQVVSLYRKRVVYFRKENGGASSARNLGIQKSHGEYIAFLDADDQWHKDKLRRQIEAFKVDNIGFSLTELEIVDEENKHVRFSNIRKQLGADGDIFANLLAKPLCTCSFLLFRKDVLENIGVFDENLTTAEDIDLLLRAAAKYRCAIIDHPLVKYRKSSDSLSRKLFTQNRIRVIHKIESYSPEKYQTHQALIRKTLSVIHRDYGKDLLYYRHLDESRRQLLTSLKMQFSMKAVILFVKFLILNKIIKLKEI